MIKMMKIHPTDVDPMGAAFALHEAEIAGLITEDVATFIAAKASKASATLLAGESLFTTSVDGDLLEIKLADKEPENQETTND